MLNRLRPRSVYDVMAAIGMFAALATGGAYAANEWNGSNIQDGTLTGVDIQDLSLGLPDYGANSISTGKLKDQDVRTQDLRDLGVTNSKIAWDSVSSGKVIDNNLTGVDIAGLTGGDITNGTLSKSEFDHEAHQLDPIALNSNTCEYFGLSASGVGDGFLLVDPPPNAHPLVVVGPSTESLSGGILEFHLCNFTHGVVDAPSGLYRFLAI
jgi:hypothetical protein